MKEWKENTFNSHTLALKKVTKVRTESKKENMLKIFIDESRHIFVEQYNLQFKNKSAFNVKQQKKRYRIYEEKYI